MVLIYSILIRLYGVAVWCASAFLPKARQWSAGRKGLFQQLERKIPEKKQWIWMHVSSLGEFEQGRPLLEKIRDRHPGVAILLTFFSPSGYAVRKDFHGADLVTYMPLDTPGNARRFVGTVRPAVALFVKYDIWYHHLYALEQAEVPTFLISANLRSDQVYFKPWGKFIRSRLGNLQTIFTQTESCAAMLKDKGFRNVSHAGDTRLDRVLTIARTEHDFGWLKTCLGEGPVLVAGSTWPEDERRLLPAILELDVPAIVAPHEIGTSRLEEIAGQLPGAVRLSELRAAPRPVRWVIVDTIGELAFLYAMGSVAYIGGGFGKGIHNILEPVAYGLPVIIGPRYQKFAEAVALKEAGAVTVITTSEDMQSAWLNFSDAGNRKQVRTVIDAYIKEHRGATERIYDVVKGSID